MQCPYCGAELAATACPACGSDNLPEALFCSHCGAQLTLDTPPDLADRVLCPDGACLGTLNEHGECSYCGFAYKTVVAWEADHG